MHCHHSRSNAKPHCPCFRKRTYASPRVVRQRKRRKKSSDGTNDGANRNHNVFKVSDRIGQIATKTSISKSAILVLLVIMPTFQAILFSLFHGEASESVFAGAQMILDHPKRQISGARPLTLYNRIRISPPYLLPLNYTRFKGERLSKVDDLDLERPGQMNRTVLSTRSKQNVLLNRLSSAKLVEALLRHSLSENNMPLSFLQPQRMTVMKEETSSFEGDRTSISRKNSDQVVTHSPDQLNKGETSADKSHASKAEDTEADASEKKNSKSTDKNRSDLFDASSLNYLVERLLSVDSLKRNMAGQAHRRPSIRGEEHAAENSNSLKFKSSLSSKPKYRPAAETPKTLDVLIREEYNSRVEPMLKSLLVQQQLHKSSQPAAQSTTKSTSQSNHRTTNLFSTVASTTLNPVSVDQLKSELSTDKPDEANINATTQPEEQNHNLIVDFEDAADMDGDSEGEEFEEEEEEMDRDRSASRKRADQDRITSKSVSKVLHNVPPYQLDSSLAQPVAGKSKHHDLINDHSEVPSTTSSTTDPISFQSQMDKVRRTDDKEKLNIMRGDRYAVATNGGPLVYSDGAKEPLRVRSNIDGQPILGVSGEVERNVSRKEPFGESVVLRQLLSTMGPLNDSQVKLKNQTNYKIQRERPTINPLVYSGYVGKDDYLISSIASDWSRPITNRDTATTSSYKHTYPISTSTRKPIMEPPTTFSSYSEQPATNAQSVPFMVIPTSDLPDISAQRPPHPSLLSNRSKILNHFNQTNRFIGSALRDTNPITRYSAPFNDSTRKSFPSYPVATQFQQSNSVSFPNDKQHIDTESYSSGQAEDPFSKPKQEPPKFIDSSDKGQIELPQLKVSPIVSNFPSMVSIVGPKVNSSSHRFINRPPNRNRDLDASTKTLLPTNSSWPGVSTGQHSVPRSDTKIFQLSHGDGKPEIRDKVETSTYIEDLPEQMVDVDDSNGNSTRSDLKKASTEDSQNNRVKQQSTSDYQASESDRLELASQDPDRRESHDHRQESPNRPHPPSNVTTTSATVAVKRDRQSQRKAVSDLESAGGETPLNGSDKARSGNEQQRRNQTSHLEKGANDRAPEVERDRADSNSASMQSTRLDTVSSTSLVPNSNFYGEASSESPMFDNTVSLAAPDKKSVSNGDLYQRIGAGPSSTTPSPSDGRESAGKPYDSSSAGAPKSSNKSSDRMAFILIGGSCALSVVCLVLAAMSMRCQDMCDDYRSLRNAERAALKLQKHRLKYTKNHQINRLNQQLSSLSNQQQDSSLDEFKLLSRIKQDSVPDNQLDFERSSEPATRCLNGINKPLHHLGANLHTASNSNGNLNDGFNMWSAPNCQMPLKAMMHKDSPCGCPNCLNQRWLAQSEMFTNSKHLSLLHPYYFMQNQSRFRPPFGAGSSVGTFFPRRVDDHSFLGAGGSSDAQILIDSQPAHSCSAVLDQRGILQSKSILQKSKRLHRRHSNRVESLNCDTANHGCNNPNHSHHFQHGHKYDLEPSASDESEITVDDSILCDSAKCSSHHHNRHHHHHHHHPVLHSCGTKLPQFKQSNHDRRSTQAKIAHSHHHIHQHSSSSDTGSIVQCTCNRDQQPLIPANQTRQHSARHKAVNYKQQQKHSRASVKHNGRRDKSLLVWSTNRDQLI